MKSRMVLLLFLLVCSVALSFRIMSPQRLSNSKIAMLKHPSSSRIVYEMSKLDIRVGKILSCSVLPFDKDRFSCLVDVGEPEPRTIISRMAHLIKRDRFYRQDENCVVCCNTLPVNVKGIISRGNLFYSHEKILERV